MIEDYEEFSAKEKQILDRFVTSTSSNIFVLRNLPEVIKGALFSRYSRSILGLRSLLLKEFILNESESEFGAIAGEGQPSDDSEQQLVAIKKAQNFYDRILDGYGDDSIGELGGAHLAIENVSMLAAKVIEDRRIGGSPLEKSTRYIYFDQKVDGEYLYYRDPTLMTSMFRDLYTDTCDDLFTVYSKLIPELTEVIRKDFPHDPSVSKVAYNNSLRAKVLDCLRGLLPTSSLTNMGVYGNGRFFEGLIRELHTQQLCEMRDVGEKASQELGKVIPSFVRRADLTHRNQVAYNDYMATMRAEIKHQGKKHTESLKRQENSGVRLVHADPEAPSKVAAALLFADSDVSLEEANHYCKTLSQEELEMILETAHHNRENRRHKSPRALEHADFTFEIVADFGTYRDLQRHRMLTQERQQLTCEYGYYIPPEIRDTEMEKDYVDAMERAKKAYDQIAADFPEEAQYIVPMGYNIHWYFKVNLRALQWICELRSSPAGHPTYRFVAQEMAKQISERYPLFKNFFKFVDYQGYEMGRLGQEVRAYEKSKQRIP